MPMWKGDQDIPQEETGLLLGRGKGRDQCVLVLGHLSPLQAGFQGPSAGAGDRDLCSAE